MRVLVTGDRGMVGRAVVARLTADGMETSGFDAERGQDVRDAAALSEAARGCDAVVHLAALTSDEHAPELISEVNVAGTAAALFAAGRAGARRFIHMSSVQALGIFAGQRAADYLPIDDDHPVYAARPYGLSKLAGEQLCRLFTAQTGVPTLCLRPALVLDSAWREAVAGQMRDRGGELVPWEYGAFIDADDLADAVAAGLAAPLGGHAKLVVAGPDVCSASARSSRELARTLCPQAAWRGGPEYEREPRRALVDCRRARELLGWTPRRPWAAADPAIAG